MPYLHRGSAHNVTVYFQLARVYQRPARTTGRGIQRVCRIQREFGLLSDYRNFAGLRQRCTDLVVE